MNDVPLIQNADVNSINTSIIAIKKQLNQISELLGLIDIPDAPDLSPFVRKDEVADVIEADNMNPVTSNAIATSNAMPINEVTSGNMHSVSSNAVAKRLDWTKIDINYTTTQVTTNYTTVLSNVPDFDEAIVITSMGGLLLKKSTLNYCLAYNSPRLTAGGTYDVSMSVRVMWDVRELQVRQLIKGSDAGFITIYEMYYR